MVKSRGENESQHASVDLDREALSGGWGMALCGVVYQEGLREEVILALVFMAGGQQRTVEEEEDVPERSQNPAGHCACCPHNGSPSGSHLHTLILLSADLVPSRAGLETFSENDPGSAASHNRP